VIAYKTSKQARILFVGINPHPGSFRRGVPFSNNKMFWYLLNRAGLLRETESDLRRDESLKAIYDHKFLQEYGLNFINLVDRPTIDVTKLKKGEAQPGIRRALRIISTCKPKVICFIGKIAFNTFYNSRKCDWGWQSEIAGVPVYLMHFPIRGPASVRVKELEELKRASSASIEIGRRRNSTGRRRRPQITQISQIEADPSSENLRESAKSADLNINSNPL
jgi:TDG/mug DNA glycosylase family protein